MGFRSGNLLSETPGCIMDYTGEFGLPWVGVAAKILAGIVSVCLSVAAQETWNGGHPA